ncbi:hypothetical protein BN193_06765 [Lactococcus raffinolactis 4877]|nr:hypothetical protein BN193_06765 [Lactococcus raffinolactis 4877]
MIWRHLNKKVGKYEKIIIALVSLVAIFALGFAFMSWKNPRNHPEKVSGKAETLVNETSGEKKIKIKTAGTMI